jgi:hypothetical protein
MNYSASPSSLSITNNHCDDTIEVVIEDEDVLITCSTMEHGLVSCERKLRLPLEGLYTMLHSKFEEMTLQKKLTADQNFISQEAAANKKAHYEATLKRLEARRISKDD